jgi:hypothetical protein
VTDSILCVTCPVYRPRNQPNQPKTPQVCDVCRTRLATDLATIPDAYAAIDAQPARGISEILTRVFESKPPLNIAALSLLGPGTDTPLATLDFWVQDWAGYLEQAVPVAAVSSHARWLAARLPWACDQHPAIDDFATDVHDLTGQLRAFESKDRGEYVGRCPRLVGVARCNTALYVDPYVDEIQCRRCKQRWKRRGGEWMHLRAQQLSAEVESA